MGQEHPPTIPSQLMDYEDITTARPREASTGPAWGKVLLRVLVVAVAVLALYKLARH